MTIQSVLLASGLALGVALAQAADGRAAEGESSQFRFVSLEHPARAYAHRLADVDGDGRIDLSWVFAASDDPKVHRLRSCLQGPEASFSRCFELELPADLRAFDLGEVDGRPGSELVLVTHTGALIASFEGQGFGVPRPLPDGQTLLSGTNEGPPLALRLLFDLDADGRSEVLLPTSQGPALHRFGAEGFERVQVLESRARVRYAHRSNGLDLNSTSGRIHANSLSTTATTPALFVEDFDGDGRKDIVTLSGNRIHVFLQAPGGLYATKPSTEIERSILTAQELDSELAGEAVVFADLDGDGSADLVATKWGSPEERTRLDRHVFFARPGLQYPEQADQIVRSESVFPNFELHDLNQDGRLDMVVPYFHFAPAQAFKVMTESALRVQLRLFLMGEDGRYGQDPGKTFARVDRRVVLDYHLDILGMIFGDGSRPSGDFEPLLTFRGDFNGDGYPDLIADSGDDHLHFYWGNAEAQYARSPDLVIDYESSLVSDLVDLNADGKTDVVTYYGRESVRWKGPTELERYEKTKRRRKLAREQRARRSATKPAGAPAESRIKMLISR